MKKSLRFQNLLGAWVILFIFTISPGLQAQANEWPREINTSKALIVIYQPQPETFKDNHLTARSAVSVTMKDNPEPIYGAAWYDATIYTDRDNRTVEAQAVKVTRVKFPDATPEQEEKFIEIVSQGMTQWKLKGSLDRLLTTLELAKKEQALADHPNTQPPKIIFSKTPATLVSIDGEPILKTIEGSEVQRVVNTPFQIFYVPTAKQYYLKGGIQWYSSADLQGNWSVNPQVPDTVSKVAATANSNSPDTNPDQSGTTKIIVVTEPAELIVSEGPPQWAPIAATDLNYMKNTASAVFYQEPTQTHYVMFSGRWFASTPAASKATGSASGETIWSELVAALQPAPQPDSSLAGADDLQGPWVYVNPDQLPDSFRKIPADFQVSGILASIPGTDEAQDAVMDAQIPQTAVINKSTAKFTPTYDGSPKFEKVSGTSMDYAVNTPDQIIKDDGKYYAVDQGVWYVADKPEGPYQVADQRPKNVDQIPPENPNYNTKYVYIYDTDPVNNTVTTGYTAGYLGSFILGTAMGAALSYGTGYYYRPWYGNYYYPRPWSYGSRAYYNPYTGGWAYRGAHGGAWYRPGGYYGGNGYWGVGGYRNAHVNNINIGQVNVNREWNQNNLYDRQKNINRNVDSNRLNQINNQRLEKLGGSKTLAGRDGSRLSGNLSNDVFADKNGNVFRREKDGQWQQNEGRNWNNVNKPAGIDDNMANRRTEAANNRGAGLQDRQADRPSDGPANRPAAAERPRAAQQPAKTRPTPNRNADFDRSHMERQNQARERGNQRTHDYQNYRSSFGNAGGGFDRGGGGEFRGGGGGFDRGGGGFRGGGGGRRR